MFRNTQLTLLGLLVLLAMPAAQAEEIIFFQDFGCDGGVNDNCGAATTPQSWSYVGGTATYQTFNAQYGVTETISADSSTRIEDNPSNFSVTGRNWDIHDGDDNPYVSGYKDPGSATNPNMSGNMLGHEDENYDHHEDNYYQIDGIQLASNIDSAQLMFDFDSWINGWVDGYKDVDGFAVAIAVGGGGFDLLNPTGDSDMQYRKLGDVGVPDGNIGDGSLNALVGESTAYGADIYGFDGWDSTMNMAGTAMFDLSGFAGQTISLRFAFASNSSGSLAEGINIDNIKVTQVCTSGSGPDCDTPPGTGVPEPASAALALLGLTAMVRRRRRAAH